MPDGDEVIYPPQGFCIGFFPGGMIGPFATEEEARRVLSEARICVVGANFEPDRSKQGHFDSEWNFLGHDTTGALLKEHEHRTVGPHRAWCYECREWCYPFDGCIRCKHPEG